jgi:asparagine synthase (glutamine-hydrolysing)
MKGKYILRETFKDFLPPEINKRGKQGFAIPLDKWFRKEWNNFWKEIVLSSRAIKRGYFKKEALEELMGEHEKGWRNHGYRLWALLVLELWQRIFMDKEEKFC